ncbi:hypothetical protein V8E53_009799 [Lactarius tabidus]
MTVLLKTAYDVLGWKPTSFNTLHIVLVTLLPLTPRKTPKIEQSRTTCGKGSRIPRSASMSKRGRRLNNNFDRTVRSKIHTSRASSDISSAQPHLVNGTSLHKHVDLELPWPCATIGPSLRCTSPLPALRERKNTYQPPSEEGTKLFRVLMGDLLLRISERKIDMTIMRDGQPESATNRSMEVVPIEQNVSKRSHAALFKYQTLLAKAGDDAWTVIVHFYNPYPESIMGELEQR